MQSINKILIFSFEEPQPPTITTALVYASLGIQVKLVTLFCSSRTMEILAEKGVSIVCVLAKQPHECLSWVARKYFGGLRKFIGYKPRVEFAWQPFRNATWKMLGKELLQTDILWVASVWSAFFLGRRLLKESYILHILELYEAETRLLKKYALQAKCVVEPEISRASIHQVWLGLHKTPIVIPNKPFYHLRQRKLEIVDVNAKAMIQTCSDKKIIVYQGVIDKDRPLCCFAGAMHALRESATWVIMGKYNTYIDSLKEICPSLIYIGFVPNPDHLSITSHASVGVLQYSASMLNNIFCAPNKVWEYSGFGIPALVPDVPSLRYFYDRFHAGEFCDFDNQDDIVCKVKKILAAYEDYEEGCVKMFDAVDLVSLYQLAINNICK
jgi:hypothetical protein